MKNILSFSGIFIFGASAVFLFTLSGEVAWAAPMKGNLFEKGSNRQKLLYRFQRNEQVFEGGRTVAKAIFADPSGVEAVVEELTLEGDKIKTYQVHHKQIGEERLLEVKGGKLLFTLTRDGKTETAEEDLPANLVIGPTIADILKKNWDTLMKGDDVVARFASLERKETVGFKFTKDIETSVDGKNRVVIKMKPTSFIIAALVSPIFFTFDKGTRLLLEVEGRTLPKQRVDGRWKDLDADVVYQY